MKKTIVALILCVLLHMAACKGPLIEKGLRYVLLPKIEAGLKNLAYETLTRLHRFCQEKEIDLGDARVHQFSIVITGIELAHDPRLQDIIKDNFPDWQADAAKNQLVLSLKPEIQSRLQVRMMMQTMAALKDRLSQKTALYPSIQQLGMPPKARILVTLVTEEELALYNLFLSQGILEFYPVVGGPFTSKEELNATYMKGIQPHWKVVESKGGQWYILNRWSVVTGQDIEAAKSVTDQSGSPAVAITFNEMAAKRLEIFSNANIGKMLAIVLDGRIYSAPRLESAISRDVRITGQFKEEEVEDLVNMLRNGALPVPLKLLEERKITGELEFEEGIVIEFTSGTDQKIVDVRKKLDQTNVGKFFLQQAGGGHWILNLTDIGKEFNQKQFLDKLTAAVGRVNLIAIETIGSPVKIK